MAQSVSIGKGKTFPLKPQMERKKIERATYTEGQKLHDQTNAISNHQSQNNKEHYAQASSK